MVLDRTEEVVLNENDAAIVLGEADKATEYERRQLLSMAAQYLSSLNALARKYQFSTWSIVVTPSGCLYIESRMSCNRMCVSDDVESFVKSLENFSYTLYSITEQMKERPWWVKLTESLST